MAITTHTLVQLTHTDLAHVQPHAHRIGTSGHLVSLSVAPGLSIQFDSVDDAVSWGNTLVTALATLKVDDSSTVADTSSK